jgi:hypothetical protein
MPQQNTTQQSSLLGQPEDITANKTLTEFDTGKEFRITAGSAIVVTLPDLADTANPITDGWNCAIHVLTNFSHSVTASVGSAGARQTIYGAAAVGYAASCEFLVGAPVGGVQARSDTDMYNLTAVGSRITFQKNGTQWIIGGVSQTGFNGAAAVCGFNSLD